MEQKCIGVYHNASLATDITRDADDLSKILSAVDWTAC